MTWNEASSTTESRTTLLVKLSISLNTLTVAIICIFHKMMLPIEKLTNIRLISMEYLSVLDHSSNILKKKSKTKVEERHCV